MEIQGLRNDRGNEKYDRGPDLTQGFHDFISFLKKPKFNFKSDDPERFLTLNLLFGFFWLFVMFVSAPLLTFAGAADLPNSLNELMSNYPKWVFVLLAVVVAPLFEEMFFRFHLRYPMLGYFLFVSGLFLGLYALVHNELISMITFIVLAVILAIVLIFLSIKKPIKTQAETIYKKFFILIFYLTVLIFALVHLFNYSGIENWWSAPLLVMPQALISLFLGYVRVRNGILVSIYFHGFYNLIPTFFFLLLF